jgi:glucosyl-dolichyl phosphate glucuronosyltransferase
MGEPVTGPILTVAIPTYNRAELLATALRSLAEQDAPAGEWRVLAVDNNCTDKTAAQVRTLATKWPWLSLVSEPRQGLSHARNCALACCPSGWLLFVDDECTFPPGYIARALRIISERRPLVFGGPIYPWYQKPPPAWFRPEYGSFSLPNETGRSSRIFLSGGNIGFEVAALRAVGGFNPSLGMIGGSVGFGEETDAEERILQRYGPDAVWFDPEFVNFHLVRPEKYQWNSLIREHFQRGGARAHVARLLASKPADGGAAPAPDCLKPQTPVRKAYKRTWQNIAYEQGLPFVRLLGLAHGYLRM